MTTVFSAKVYEHLSKVEANMLAKKTTVKLSNTSKLGVKSWSLQALDTCPASIGKDGKLVDACKGCYATQGQYYFSNVIAPRLYNQNAWKHEHFVSDFVKALKHESYFRWFDSGDLYDIRLAEKIYQIMVQTPHVMHWMPTRMYKFSKFKNILERMHALHNCVIRLSSDSIQGDIVENKHNVAIDTNSTIIADDALHTLQNGVFICQAPQQNGKCLECKACYVKSTKTIAYIAHGRKMISNIKRNNAINLINL